MYRCVTICRHLAGEYRRVSVRAVKTSKCGERMQRRNLWHNRQVNEKEATRVLDGVVAELRREPYTTLVARYLDESDGRTVVAESGVEYQVEVQGLWDRPRQPGNLRVIISIDDGGWRAFSPLSTDFIVASDGSFVGE